MRTPECHPDRKYGGNGLCRSCYSTAWYKKNADKRRAKAKAYYDTGRPKKNHLAWRERNRESLRKRSAENYSKNPAKAMAATRSWQRRNPEKMRDILLKKYGITSAEYDALLLRQGGVCAGCLSVCTVKKNLAVDHDHETGKIRGLLCSRCNSILGYAKDDSRTLQRLTKYLESGRLIERGCNLV